MLKLEYYNITDKVLSFRSRIVVRKANNAGGYVFTEQSTL